VSRHVKRFRGGLVFKAHRWLYHSTLGSGVIKKEKKSEPRGRKGADDDRLASSTLQGYLAHKKRRHPRISIGP